jgi:hypothetical protein
MLRHVRSTLMALVALGCALMMTPATAHAGSGHAQVMPPHPHPFGVSYGVWSAAWWEWALSLPATGHPLLQSGPVDCGAGQSGGVWFIGGSFSPGQTERSCQVPAGTALFLPVVNNVSLAFPTDPDSPRLLRRHAREAVDTATGLFATVDGRTVDTFARYRADSPLLFVRMGPDNLFGLDEGTLLRGVSDGYWLMIAPLPPGQHHLRFGGTMGDFSLDISYEITVPAARTSHTAGTVHELPA